MPRACTSGGRGSHPPCPHTPCRQPPAPPLLPPQAPHCPAAAVVAAETHPQRAPLTPPWPLPKAPPLPLLCAAWLGTAEAVRECPSPSPLSPSCAACTSRAAPARASAGPRPQPAGRRGVRHDGQTWALTALTALTRRLSLGSRPDPVPSLSATPGTPALTHCWNQTEPSTLTHAHVHKCCHPPPCPASASCRTCPCPS